MCPYRWIEIHKPFFGVVALWDQRGHQSSGIWGSKFKFDPFFYIYFYRIQWADSGSGLVLFHILRKLFSEVLQALRLEKHVLQSFISFWVLFIIIIIWMIIKLLDSKDRLKLKIQVYRNVWRRLKYWTYRNGLCLIYFSAAKYII